MSLFKKIFGSSTDASAEENQGEHNHQNHSNLSVDEAFTFNFKKNGGKFIYCENLDEVREQFENILEENDWFESEAFCFDPKLYHFLEDNNINHVNVKEPKFLFAGCENLIAEDGSVLFSSNQIKQLKPDQLPGNIILFATTNQLLEYKSDGLPAIRNKYVTDYPTNITSIKYFKKVQDEDFLTYGSSAKNLYLLLLEDL